VTGQRISAPDHPLKEPGNQWKPGSRKGRNGNKKPDRNTQSSVPGCDQSVYRYDNDSFTDCQQKPAFYCAFLRYGKNIGAHFVHSAIFGSFDKKPKDKIVIDFTAPIGYSFLVK